MQPSDVSFGVLMAVLALATVVATALTWDRGVRLRRTRRVATLVVSQVLVVLTMLVVVNIQQTFYTNWSELGGEENIATSDYLANVDPDSGFPIADSPGQKSGLSAKTVSPQQLKIAVTAAEKAYAKKPGKGVVVPTQLTGAKTHYSLPARVYLPAAYFDKTTPNRRFPVIIFLSGYPSNVDIPFQKLQVHDELDKLIAAGTMQPTIVVVPEQHPRARHDSACVDAVHGGDQAETYIAVDVPKIIERELRVSEERTHWSIMGFSTGGYCAVNLALRHSERFGNALSLSGNMHPIVDATTGDLFGNDTELLDSNTPLKTVGQGGHLPLRFFMFSSMGDAGAVPEMKAFVPKVHKPDTVRAEYKPDGGHNSIVWRWALPKAFEWLGQQMPPVNSAL